MAGLTILSFFSIWSTTIGSICESQLDDALLSSAKKYSASFMSKASLRVMLIQYRLFISFVIIFYSPLLARGQGIAGVLYRTTRLALIVVG
jgi:hypothetical protein